VRCHAIDVHNWVITSQALFVGDLASMTAGAAEAILGDKTTPWPIPSVVPVITTIIQDPGTNRHGRMEAGWA
jgi:hypothetical protein